MPCRAAMNSIMWKPKYFQTMTIRIASIEVCGLASRCGASAPNSAVDGGQQAVIAVVDEAEDQAGGDLGQHVGQEEQHAQRDRAAESLGQGMMASASASGSWTSSETTMIRTLLRSARPNARVFEHEAVIVEADPVGRPAEAVPVEAAVPAGLADRQDDEQREQQQRRRQEQHDRGELARRAEQLAERTPHAARASRARASSPQQPRRGRPRTSAGCAQLPCFQASWMALAASFGRHAAAGDLGGGVVDHATDRGAERLVEKFWWYFERAMFCAMLLHEGAGEARLRALVRRE